jgi:formiminotetrahydrofolate cyclodeaminase
MPDFRNAPMRQYLDDLASAEPTPGGGSAAGLVGALGAALLSMSARFTVGRTRYAPFDEAATMVLAVAEGLRAELAQLMEEDAAAYALYGTALALPKSTDDEKETRRRAMQDATRAAAQAPMGIARLCYRVLEMAPVLAANCNPNLVSDVVVATHLALGAFRGAVLNVRINLKYLDDAAYVACLSDALAPMVGNAAALADRALTIAYQTMQLPLEGVSTTR